MKKGYFKTGENRKLSQKRTDPWSVLKKLANGVNFEIINDTTRERKLIHHDRLKRIKGDCNKKQFEFQTSASENNGYVSSTSTSSSSATSYFSPAKESAASETNTENNVRSPYPMRIRTQRRLSGTIP